MDCREIGKCCLYIASCRRLSCPPGVNSQTHKTFSKSLPSPDLSAHQPGRLSSDLGNQQSHLHEAPRDTVFHNRALRVAQEQVLPASLLSPQNPTLNLAKVKSRASFAKNPLHMLICVTILFSKRLAELLGRLAGAKFSICLGL